MTAKYKVVFERSACIGAAACVASFPEAWVMQDDSKPNLVGEGVTGNAEKQELVIDEKDLEKHLEAARVCPVIVIHVYNLETGEQLI